MGPTACTVHMVLLLLMVRTVLLLLMVRTAPTWVTQVTVSPTRLMLCLAFILQLRRPLTTRAPTTRAPTLLVPTRMYLPFAQFLILQLRLSMGLGMPLGTPLV